MYGYPHSPRVGIPPRQGGKDGASEHVPLGWALLNTMGWDSGGNMWAEAGNVNDLPSSRKEEKDQE